MSSWAYQPKMRLRFSFSAQANPYPRANPARTSKNHSPPPRSNSVSATPRLSSMEASSSQPEPLPSSRRSRSNTTSRRVRFTPEANNERLLNPKDNARPNGPATHEPPARKPPATQVPSQVPDEGWGHPADIAFSLAPIRHSSPNESVAAVEEISSDESERLNDRDPEIAQTRIPSRKDDSIRSGIADLLKANKEVPMVDVDTANALVSLLSQMDDDDSNRLVLFNSSAWTDHSAFRARANPGPVNSVARTRTGARFVGRTTPRSFSLTAHLSDPQSELTQMPIRTVREFQSSTGRGETVWWESHSEGNLASPLHDVNRTIGDLYIHRSTSEPLIQIWICRDSNSWEKVALEYDVKYHPDRVIKGLSHPSFPDRRLKLRKNGEPSWIMNQTCATIKSRRKGTQ